MIEEKIREKLSSGMVINAPGVLEHLKSLGYEIYEDAKNPKTKALYISAYYVEPLSAALYSCTNFLLPQDILDIPIPEPIITEWDYQVGDFVEMVKDYGELCKGEVYEILEVYKGETLKPITVDTEEWSDAPHIGTFKLVKKAERKVTVEMSKETYESLKESLKDVEVLND